VRTTGAPNSVTSGAAAAAGAPFSRGAMPPRVSGVGELPSAIPAFLEACAKLAGNAASRGDLVGAREIIGKAARAAELRGDA